MLGTQPSNSCSPNLTECPEESEAKRPQNLCFYFLISHLSKEFLLLKMHSCPGNRERHFPVSNLHLRMGQTKHWPHYKWSPRHILPTVTSHSDLSSKSFPWLYNRIPSWFGVHLNLWSATQCVFRPIGKPALHQITTSGFMPHPGPFTSFLLFSGVTGISHACVH